MPYLPHVRITARFALGASGAPTEAASCTLNFKPPTIPWTPEGRQTVVNDAFADWSTWVSSGAESRVTSNVKLTECRLYMIDESGHITEDPAVSEGDQVSGVMPITNGHPYQVTNVVTLVAGARGKGRFGRIYLPPQTFTIEPDGTITAAHRTAMFTSVRTLLENLSNLPGVDTGFGLAVAGRTGTGTLRTVDEVRFGLVADTQRRRRRSLNEAYSAAPFAA